MAIQYLDFDLLIERSAGGYKARVLESPAGEASIEFAVPFTQQDIDNFFVQIGQTRSFETQQTRRIRDFGQSLFEAVFSGAVRDRLRSSMGEASLHSNGLRIRLRLSGTPELGSLPWEFLYDSGASRFLALSVETPVVRYLETPQLAQPFAVQPPLRILAVICGPQDYPRLDTEQEWQNLQESMRGLQSRGLVDLQRLDPPTLSSLQQQLRRDQYHILHFVGHGVFSKNDQDGYLLFENAQRGGQRISGHDLGTILHDHRPLRLAVLNACEGARASDNDQFAGTAQSLIQQGIPAVIAMQFRITDQASIMLAHEFYGALADGYPVDAALTEARKAIKTEGNDLEWGTPVLYMRTPDGRIFDIAQQPAPVSRLRSPASVQDTEKESRLDRLYTEGLEAYYLGQWESACMRFQAIVDLDPDYKDAGEKLEAARRKINIQSLNEEALSAERAKDWAGVISALERLAQQDPTFPEMTARIAGARKQQQLGEMLAEAEHLAQAEKWEAVLGILKEMEKVDPRHSEIPGLRSRAEQALAKEKLNRDLESSYNSALQAMNAGDTPGALRHLRRVRQLQAGYRESDELLRRLESEQKRAPKIEKKKRPAPAPITGLIATIPADSIRLEWSLLRLTGLFALCAVLLQFLNLGIDAFKDSLPSELVILLHWAPSGILGGLIFWGFLSRAVGALNLSEKLQILGASALGQLIIGIFVGDSELPPWTWYTLCAIYGAIFGAVMSGILRAKGEIPGWRQFFTITIAWSLAYGLSALFGVNVGWELNYKGIISEGTTWLSLVPVMLTLGAFIGGWFTLSQLRANRGRVVNWKTVAAGALGFALGGLILDSLINSGESLGVQGLVVGLIGGAALAFPSRSIMRYLGLSLALGLTTWLVRSLFGEYDVVFMLICGALVGLVLGLETRRVSGALTGLVLGITTFGLGFSLGSGPYAFPFSLPTWLGIGLVGALLAVGWSYLKSPAAPAPVVSAD